MKYVLFSLFFVFLFSVNSCGDKVESANCSETLATGCARCCDEDFYSKFCDGEKSIIIYRKSDLSKIYKEYATEKYPNFNADSFIVFYKRHGNAKATCQKF
jgi:hypothetical protein